MGSNNDDLQERKRQLMTRKLPKKPANRKQPMLIKVPVLMQDEDYLEANRRDPRHAMQRTRPEESDSDNDLTRLNRSYSVDTSYYMRHLQRKGNNFDVQLNLNSEEKELSLTPLHH